MQKKQESPTPPERREEPVMGIWMYGATWLLAFLLFVGGFFILVILGSIVSR